MRSCVISISHSNNILHLTYRLTLKLQCLPKNLFNMAMQKLTPQACLEKLEALPLWQCDTATESIKREFVFRDFVQAFSFMTQIAELAEQHNHHPNWFNVFNKVSVTWTTHDVMGLSENDFLMAHACDVVFKNC